jgi:hypothetical protein
MAQMPDSRRSIVSNKYLDRLFFWTGSSAKIMLLCFFLEDFQTREEKSSPEFNGSH